MSSRRDFLGLAGATAMCGVLRPVLLAAETSPAKPEYSLFTKHLVGLPFDQLAEVVADLGFKGVEIPVRKGGHVEPLHVEDDLPRLAEALKRHGLAITMITTDINEVNQADRSEVVIRTAAKLGIPRFRMKWYSYESSQSRWAQLDAIKSRLRDLVALSKECAVLPCYQNHSGAKYVGAGIWDMAMLMREYRPQELAWAFDFFHATVEGGLSWPNELALVREHISIVYYKNFIWEGRMPRGCPLAGGVVGKDSVSLLRKASYRGPVCLHVEYLKGKITDVGALKVAVDFTRKDFSTLKEWWV